MCSMRFHGRKIRECVLTAGAAGARAPRCKSVDARRVGCRQDKFVQNRCSEAEHLGSGQARHPHPLCGIMFAWQAAPGPLTVHSDNHLVGEKEHVEEHSLLSALASQLEQRPDCHCDELRRSRVVRCVRRDTAGHGDGRRLSRAWGASRCHGIASERQCSHWNHWHAGTGKSETSGP